MEANDRKIPEREENAVKGEYGHVLVVAGSDRYTNTPAILSLGALRVGTDLLTVTCPGRSAHITPGFALNIVSEPLDGSHLSPDHLDTVLDLADGTDCLAVGPGLGTAEETREAVTDLLGSYGGPAVVDADAIHAAAERPTVLEENILTPHAGEFEALTGEYPGDDMEEREEAVREAAAELSCTVLLKGPEDVISDGEAVATNGTGNPSMTRGGTGDVLAGITAGLLAQGLEPFDAAVTAARVNGEAGDRALEEHGGGFLLEEMLEAVSAVVGGGGSP